MALDHRSWIGMLGVLAAFVVACGERQQANVPQPTSSSSAMGLQGPMERQISFVDVAASLGVTLRNVSGSEQKRFIVETTGSGACFLDFDLDGDLDLYLVNGGTLETWRRENPARNALYRNDGGRFVDVTAEAGVSDAGWGGGCSVADPDNDGDPDVYVTNFGRNVFYRNLSDGRFEDVTTEAGVGDERWGAGSAFADVDLDGDLDLYLVNYVEFDTADLAAHPTDCRWKGAPVMCGPRGFPGQTDVLYLNQGDGTFRMSADRSVSGFARYGLGVVAGDLDTDGDPDFYVANDSQQNLLLLNSGDGHFEERGLAGGVAVSGDGRRQAGMGVDLGDYDGDGDEDVFVTNFSDDYHTLYRNDGKALFTDVSLSAGLSPTRPSLGWGGGFFDYDNDGDLDLFVAGGHVYPQVDDHDPGTRYRQRNMIFRNEGGGRFRDVSDESGPGLLAEQPSRGVAFGDYDDDGDIDIVVVNENDVPAVLRNDGGNARHWLKIRLAGSKSNRDGIGARLTSTTATGRQFREYRRNAGYYSSHDPRLHFGLGEATIVQRLEIVWPSGTRQVFADLPADHLVTVHEERGVVSMTRLRGAGTPDTPSQPAMKAPTTAVTRIAVPRAAGRENPAAPDELREIEGLVMRGTDDILAGRFDAAVKAYVTALDHMPNWEQASADPAAVGFGDPRQYGDLLSGIYDNMGVALMRAEHVDACAEAIGLAIEIWPRRAKYHHNLGLCHFHARRYADAVDALENSRKLDPNRIEIFYDLGRALVMAGRCDEAQKELKLATRALPTPDLRGRRAESWYHLGSCHAEAGRFEEAAHAYRETLSLVPGHQKALYKLGQSLRRNGQDEAADGVLALFEERQPVEDAIRGAKLAGSGEPRQRLLLAQAYLAAGQPQRALLEVRTVLAAQPAQPLALALMGQTAMALRPPRMDLAENAYGRALVRNPQAADPLAGLAAVRLRQRSTGPAAELFGRAIESDRNSVAARLGLARVGIAEGRGSEALTALTDLLVAAPRDPTVLRAMAEVLVAKDAGSAGDPERALRLLDRAGGLYGEDVEIRVRALIDLGRIDEARQIVSTSPFLGASQRDALSAW